MTTKFNRFDMPFYEKPDESTPEMMDILSVGREGDVFKLKKESLIKKIPINISDSNNNNLFHLILRDDLKKTQTAIINFFKYLIQNNTNPEQPNSDNRTPLHFAAMNQYDKIIDYLLEIGCNPNFRDNFGMTSMHYFISGKVKLFKNKEVNAIKNYSKTIDVKKNKQLQELRINIGKYLENEYKPYFNKFRDIITDISLDRELAKQLKEIINQQSTDAFEIGDVSENNLQRVKQIRAILEKRITDIMNPVDLKLNTDIKIKTDETNVGVEQNINLADDNVNYYIFDKWDVNEVRKNIGENISEYGEELEGIIENAINNIIDSDKLNSEYHADGININKKFVTRIARSLNGNADIDLKDGLEKDTSNGIITPNTPNIIDVMLNNNYHILKVKLTLEEIRDNLVDTDYTNDRIRNLNAYINYINELLDLAINGNLNIPQKKSQLTKKIDAYRRINDRTSLVNQLVKIEKKVLIDDKVFYDGELENNNLKSDDNKEIYIEYWNEKTQEKVYNIIKLIKEYSKANKDDYRKNIINQFKEFTVYLKKNSFLIRDMIPYFNKLIETFNEINLLRIVSDMVGFTKNDDGITVNIASFYDFILPPVEHTDEDIKLTNEITDDDKYYTNKSNLDFNKADNYQNLTIKTLDQKFDGNNMEFFKLHNKNVNELLKYFIKLVIKKFNNDDIKNTVSQIYDQHINLKFTDNGYSNLIELNKEKFLIDTVINVVKNILSNYIDNQVVELMRRTLQRPSDAKRLETLNFANNNEMTIDFKLDLNDIELNKTDIDKKKFIIFSDDYSNLEIEKELLELIIKNNSFRKLLEKGASVYEPDSNGKLPIDLIIDNKYYCLVEKYQNWGYNLNKGNVIDEANFKYILDTFKHHLSTWNRQYFTENHFNDIKELIENNDDYKFMFKNVKDSFNSCYDRSKNIILGSLKNQIENSNNELTLTNRKELIIDPINKLKDIYTNCVKYFTGSKYLNETEYKKQLNKMLIILTNKYVKVQIKSFIKKIIISFYKFNARHSESSLDILFTAGTLRGKSVNQQLESLMHEFIKNACELFEDEDDEDSHNYRTADQLLDNFMDEFTTNTYIPMKFSSKLAQILKKRVNDYFSPYVYKLIQNYMVVYENNLKFIINHYRLLKIIKAITD